MARILLVDDSSFQRLMIKNLLLVRGHETVLAENGAIGLEQLDQPLDAVLVDLFMPIVDGFEFLERLVQREDAPPVIVVTADIDEQARQRCAALGVRAFVNKPITGEPLYHALAQVLGTSPQPSEPGA